MALTGLAIYKLLPKTNCAECHSPTCLAFAMRLAQKQATMEECPYISEEAKGVLTAESAPPIQQVTIGSDGKQVVIGNETVLFRHEETFRHPTSLAISLPDTLSSDALRERIKLIEGLSFERVGTTIGTDMVLLDNASGDAATFAKAAEVAQGSSLALILKSPQPAAMREALKICGKRKPLLYAATSENYQEMAQLAKEHSCPLVAYAEGLEPLSQLTQKIKEQGVNDIVLDSGSRKVSQVLQDLTKIRRYSLRKKFRPLGYPAMAFTSSSDPFQKVAEAATYVAKYAAIVVTDCTERWQILPILTVRQDIYTDPRTPAKVEPGIHMVGEPGPQSPLMVTTNFSITYYTVEGDVEASKVPAYILVVDTEGTSVLTAWASDKFSTEHIAKAMEKNQVASKVGHKKIILPGLIAVESGKLQEETGWQVMVGPRESSGLATYLRTQWKA